MQSKLVLIIIDKGDTYWITGAGIQPEDFIPDKTVHVLPYHDKILFDKIRELIKTNKVEYEKPLQGKLVEDDLIVTPLDQFELDRERFFTKGMEYMSSRIKVGSLFDFFNFIVSNNKLLDKGYVITDENRVDKYLEVVDAGNDDLIETLETFLTSRDRLMEHSGFYNIWKKYNDAIETSYDVEEMRDLYKEFVNMFE